MLAHLGDQRVERSARRPLSAAVTLPPLPTRRLAEELLCPERVTSPARQTVGNNRVQSVSESDVKWRARADRRCLRGARQGVSFALLKGLVRRFLHTRRPPLYFLIPLFVNIIERVSRTSFYPTS